MPSVALRVVRPLNRALDIGSHRLHLRSKRWRFRFPEMVLQMASLQGRNVAFQL